jgi:hypothetical protein
MALLCSPSQQPSSLFNHLHHHSRMTCDTGTICLGSSASGRPSTRHTSTVDKTRLVGHRRRHHIIPRHRTRPTKATAPDVVPIIITRTRIITCTRMPPGTDCRRRRIVPSPHHLPSSWSFIWIIPSRKHTVSTLCSNVAELLSLGL